MKRLAIIEDDQQLLKRMAFFLDKQEGMKCSIGSGSLGEFFEKLPDYSTIDLILLDIELSDTINTIDHIQKLKSLLPQARVVIITGHNHPEYIYSALQNGADSFYLKGSGLDKLLEAIEATLEGGSYLDPEAAAHIRKLIRGEAQAAPPLTAPAGGRKNAPGLNSLPQREKQVAEGLLRGKSYQEIAEDIHLSINTVRHYVKVLYKKFEVSNKIQLSNKLKK